MAMRKNLNVVVVAVLAVATLFHGSAAQRRHVVGDGTGWTIPSGGAATYATWAAKVNFSIGDTLVFNFTNGQHDVAKVTKSAFDSCNSGSTLFTLTNSPASVPLNETGEQYYICTFGTHCSLGQKLAINVTKASSTSPSPSPSPSPAPTPKTSPVPTPTQTPAPQPRNPTPPPATVPASAPAPSTGSATYTVGDTSGWIVPRGGAATYTTWASGKSFRVGDVLVFSYPANAHNVEEVTKENFDSCSSTSPLATYTQPPVRVTLNKTGSHYFICGIPGHCAAGQKLAINVTGSSIAATPPSTTTSPSPASSSPTGAVSPPPPNSAAASLGLLSATFLPIVAAIFY